jgi:hypothetical protein
VQFGVSGGPIDLTLPYAKIIQQRCDVNNISSPLMYALAWHETIGGELAGLWPSAAKVISGDNGHGLFQLTEEWPQNWSDPAANCDYAIKVFVAGTFHQFGERGLRGDDLVKVTAAAFNAGATTAWNAHLDGNVDAVTTDNYGAAVLSVYHDLVAHRHP